jgi:GTP-binding protein Era
VNEGMASSAISPGQERSCGFVALIGAPNAGKSTLLNALVGTKISIVTHKVQTTRMRIRGIVMQDAVQIILVDTPGIFEPTRRLERAMVAAAWAAVEEADRAVLLVDAQKGPADDLFPLLGRLSTLHKKPVLVINKIDKLAKQKLLEIVAALNEKVQFARTFLVSALTGDGVQDLLGYLAAQMPHGPWLYSEDQLGDMTERLLASEITREKIFLRLHEELPYSITVETESFQTRKDGSVRIEQVIHVTRAGQRAIVLGKGGRMIRELGELARHDMASAFGYPVHLFLRVKLSEKWPNDPERYRQMGLDFPKEEI